MQVTEQVANKLPKQATKQSSELTYLVPPQVRCEIPRERGVTSFEATLTLPRSVQRVSADVDAARRDFSHSSHFSDKDHVLHVKISRLNGGVDFNIRVKCTLDRPYTPAFLNDLGPVNLSFAIPQYTASGLAVRYLQVAKVDKNNEPGRWVRALTTSTAYTCRVN